MLLHLPKKEAPARAIDSGRSHDHRTEQLDRRALAVAQTARTFAYRRWFVALGDGVRGCRAVEDAGG